jgi:glycosyltransferase involved in cell wall biosynthesis
MNVTRLKRVCYFGTYDKSRPRNRILLEGLRKSGVEVIECHYSPWGDVEDKSQLGWVNRLWTAVRFIWGYLFLTIRYLSIGSHDGIIVGYLGHFDMFLAKPLALLRGKPLIFDAFLSLYDTVVEDRRLFSPRSIPARLLFWVDRTACRMADRILLDTRAHIDYFVKTFHLPEVRFQRVFVGAEEPLFYPCEEKEEQEQKRVDKLFPDTRPPALDGRFHVLFYGQFIPLHGIETIIRAAGLLEREDVVFTLIGKGQETAKIERLARDLNLSSIRWIDWVPYAELRKYICEADVGLGVFGSTEKARRVIPNKAFQILACRRPLITGDSSAARELLTDGESAILCRMANPEALADAILRLKRDPVLRRKVATGGYSVFRTRCQVDTESLFNFG